MIPAIRSIIAALSAACATASMLYSPALLLAIATGNDWRLQMYSPQIDRVPALVHSGSVLAFSMLAGVMCVDICAAYPDWKPVALGGCAAAVLAVVAYWFFWGPIP